MPTLIINSGANISTGSGGSGAQGPQGSQGPQGAQGSQGPQGSEGSQGSQGSAGVSGSAGSQGPQGSAGSQGPQGSTGSQGPQGSAGSQGPQGSAGSQGPQGSAGSQGSQGFQGEQGSTIYDISFEAVGTPDASAITFRFKSAREFTILSSGHVAGCASAPSTNTIFSIKLNDISIGSLTYTNSSTSGTVSITSGNSTSISVGDIITITAPASLNGISSPFCTLVGTCP